MTSNLVGRDDGHVFYVAWHDGESGEEQAWVGQDGGTSIQVLKKRQQEAKKRRDPEGWSTFEYVSIEIAAKQWCQSQGGTVRNSFGYWFETRAQALQFRRAMLAAHKSARHEYGAGVAWPDWATQAFAAGWKPPKGWKP